jgi:hypothetical protein
MLPEKISDVVAALNLWEQPAHQLGRQHAWSKLKILDLRNKIISKSNLSDIVTSILVGGPNRKKEQKLCTS